MNSFKLFWQQPNRDVRNARILFAVLTVVFAIAACSYAVAPALTVAQFASWDRLLGGGDTHYPELQNRVWIALSVANVATLSVMSWMLFRDLLKNRAVHLPLLFMKTTSATLFVLYWIAVPQARSLLVAAAGDLATAAAIWYFPTRAFRSLEANRAA